MAEVFLSKKFGVEGFQKTVAIKKILPHISEDDNFVTMFIDEAKIVARLQHANICQVYEFGRISDDFFQVMEFISGMSVKHLANHFWKKGENVPIGAAIHTIAKVCDGLGYAHSMKERSGKPLNIVHRDVTPANILVSFEGAVKLIDFGIAKATQRATKTQAGIVKGKFGYMTPEQLQGKDIDNRSDIFSLGVCLWELLAGRLLFNEANDMDNLRRIINGDYPNILEVRKDLPVELSNIVMKSLAYDRDDRYSTAEELGSDLNRMAFKMGSLWNTSKMQNFILENFMDEAKASWDSLKKFSNITEENFNSYPSIYDAAANISRSDDDSEIIDMSMVEEIDDDDLLMVEEDEFPTGDGFSVGSESPTNENRTVSVSTAIKTNDYRESGGKKRVEVSGSLERDSFDDWNSGPSRTGSSESKVMFNEMDGVELSNSDENYEDQEYETYQGNFNSGEYSNPEGFINNSDYDYLDKNQQYQQQYNNNNNYGMDYADNQQRQYNQQQPQYNQQQPQGYYADDGQWYSYDQTQQPQQYDQTQQPQGYYGEDGQWYSYDQTQQPQGYYADDGQWYYYDQQQQQPQGYYGEDGQWYSYDQQQQPQGYYGEDGQWYSYDQNGVNPYYNDPNYNNVADNYNPDYGYNNQYENYDGSPEDPNKKK